MCFGKSKSPEPSKPPAPPAPAPDMQAPTTLQYQEKEKEASQAEDNYSMKRRGRKALRIDRKPAKAGSLAAGNGSGLNIPK